MTYLDRAKKLMSAGTMALIPLSLAVTSEAATLTLEAPTSVLQFISYGGSGGGSNLGITGGGIPLARANGIQGLRLFAEAAWAFESFGSAEDGVAQISWLGNASGTAAPEFPLIPVEWEFYVGAGTPTLFSGYTLEMLFRNDISESTALSVAKTFDAPKDKFEETGKTIFSTEFNPTSYEVRLVVFFNGPLFATGTHEFSISVPEHSIDINDVSTGAVPEPSTWTLFAIGAAAILTFRLRRR